MSSSKNASKKIEQSQYKPGSLWKARATIFGVNKKNERVTIRFGDIVLLINYKLTPLLDEECFVLFKNQLVYIEAFNLGLVFNMNPTKQQ